MPPSRGGGWCFPFKRQDSSGSGSGSDSNKVGSKRFCAIDKSRRDKSSSNSKNGSKRNSGGQTLQVQGQGWWKRDQNKTAHTKTNWTMMLKWSTQGRGALRILQSTASSRPAESFVAASSARSHRYKYMEYSNAKDGDEDFVNFLTDDNNDKDLSDVEVVERANPKSR